MEAVAVLKDENLLIDNPEASEKFNQMTQDNQPKRARPVAVQPQEEVVGSIEEALAASSKDKFEDGMAENDLMDRSENREVGGASKAKQVQKAEATAEAATQVNKAVAGKEKEVEAAGPAKPKKDENEDEMAALKSLLSDNLLGELIAFPISELGAPPITQSQVEAWLSRKGNDVRQDFQQRLFTILQTQLSVLLMSVNQDLAMGKLSPSMQMQMKSLQAQLQVLTTSKNQGDFLKAFQQIMNNPQLMKALVMTFDRTLSTNGQPLTFTQLLDRAQMRQQAFDTSQMLRTMMSSLDQSGADRHQDSQMMQNNDQARTLSDHERMFQQGLFNSQNQQAEAATQTMQTQMQNQAIQQDMQNQQTQMMQAAQTATQQANTETSVVTPKEPDAVKNTETVMAEKVAQNNVAEVVKTLQDVATVLSNIAATPLNEVNVAQGQNLLKQTEILIDKAGPVLIAQMPEIAPALEGLKQTLNPAQATTQTAAPQASNSAETTTQNAPQTAKAQGPELSNITISEQRASVDQALAKTAPAQAAENNPTAPNNVANNSVAVNNPTQASATNTVREQTTTAQPNSATANTTPSAESTIQAKPQDISNVVAFTSVQGITAAPSTQTTVAPTAIDARPTLAPVINIADAIGVATDKSSATIAAPTTQHSAEIIALNPTKTSALETTQIAATIPAQSSITALDLSSGIITTTVIESALNSGLVPANAITQKAVTNDNQAVTVTTTPATLIDARPTFEGTPSIYKTAEEAQQAFNQILAEAIKELPIESVGSTEKSTGYNETATRHSDVVSESIATTNKDVTEIIEALVSKAVTREAEVARRDEARTTGENDIHVDKAATASYQEILSPAADPTAQVVTTATENQMTDLAAQPIIQPEAFKEDNKQPEKATGLTELVTPPTTKDYTDVDRDVDVKDKIDPSTGRCCVGGICADCPKLAAVKTQQLTDEWNPKIEPTTLLQPEPIKYIAPELDPEVKQEDPVVKSCRGSPGCKGVCAECGQIVLDTIKEQYNPNPSEYNPKEAISQEASGRNTNNPDQFNQSIQVNAARASAMPDMRGFQFSL